MRGLVAAWSGAEAAVVEARFETGSGDAVASLGLVAGAVAGAGGLRVSWGSGRGTSGAVGRGRVARGEAPRRPGA